MNILHVGHVDEILDGTGAGKDVVLKFVEAGHLAEKDDAGRSFAAIGILKTGAVWILSGPSRKELIETLEAAGATDAEIMELTTLN
jgi:hypothetical protein